MWPTTGLLDYRCPRSERTAAARHRVHSASEFHSSTPLLLPQLTRV